MLNGTAKKPKFCRNLTDGERGKVICTIGLYLNVGRVEGVETEEKQSDLGQTTLERHYLLWKEVFKVMCVCVFVCIRGERESGGF